MGVGSAIEVGGVEVEEPLAELLEQTAGELTAVLAESEHEIGKLSNAFEGLAEETHRVLESAATVVSCAEAEPVQSLLARVERLNAETRAFLEERLTATESILTTVASEAALLGGLERQTQAQRAIARETEMLRVLTNIEVARLGEVGVGFEYLARELSEFSLAVAESTGELMQQTGERRKHVEATRRTLTLELPRMREEFSRTEAGLANAQTAVGSILRQLSETPARFRSCVEEIAARIAGVVAAIQAHDITRQQIEHVRDFLNGAAADLRREGDVPALRTRDEKTDPGPEGCRDEGRDESTLRAGLTIQSYQLRSIGETVERWTAQIRDCLEAIGRIASAEIVELAPAVYAEQQELSSQLAWIERLEEASAKADENVRASFRSLSGLMQLVREHLQRSKSVRDRLQLLMFNSIVEASHLGTQADGILEISTTIKRISATWSEITGQSEQAIGEIAALVDASGATLADCGEGKRAGMSQAQEEMHAGLSILESAASCAETRGRQIQEEIGAVRKNLAGIGGSRDRLGNCFARLTKALEAVETARAGMPGADVADAEAMADMERRFGAGYTTEMERAVLRAALAGGPLPAAQQSFAGNDVELF